MEEDVEEEFCHWGSCPADILIMVFEYLDAKDLISCMGVNTSWRVNADYCGRESGKWFQLVEKGVENKGLNFLQRSKLDFRALYLNCRMWYSLHKAQVKLKYIYNLRGIRNIRVYRDNLIAVCKATVKFYNLETGTLVKEIFEPCVDYQETDYLVAKFTTRKAKKHISLYSKHTNETYESLGFTICNIQHNKCHLSNWKNQVHFYECTPTSVILRKLGRYYSNPKLLRAWHMYDNDMYIFTSKGDVYHRRNGELKINRVCTLDVPSPPGTLDVATEIYMTMFHECSVVYGVRNKEREGIVKNLDIYGKEHLVLLYSDLTCAVPHDDVLLLGFKDGKVGVVVVKNLWTTNDPTPVFEFYIQDVAQVQTVEPIMNLEVYEAEGCHHVLVATVTNLYQVIISHADYEKVMN